MSKKTATEVLHMEVRQRIARDTLTIKATGETKRDQSLRDRWDAILEIDLNRRPLLTVRCDLDASCQRTLARVYETSFGPLWVPARPRSTKDDIDLNRVEILKPPDTPFDDLFLPDCRDHPESQKYGTTAETILALHDEALQNDPPRRISVMYTSIARRL